MRYLNSAMLTALARQADEQALTIVAVAMRPMENQEGNPGIPCRGVGVLYDPEAVHRAMAYMFIHFSLKHIGPCAGREQRRMVHDLMDPDQWEADWFNAVPMISAYEAYARHLAEWAEET